jgi:hypothetical protein
MPEGSGTLRWEARDSSNDSEEEAWQDFADLWRELAEAFE